MKSLIVIFKSKNCEIIDVNIDCQISKSVPWIYVMHRIEVIYMCLVQTDDLRLLNCIQF